VLFRSGGRREWQKELFKPYINMNYESAIDKGWTFGIGVTDE